MNVTVSLHKIDCANGCVLIFDHDGEQYRMALYRRRDVKDKGGKVDVADFDDLVRRNLLPHGYHTSWFRVSAKHRIFSLGLAHMIEAAEVRLDPYVIEKYMRDTVWGCELP